MKILLDSFSEGEIDKVYLASNSFVNTMTQDPEINQLLPLNKIEDEEEEHEEEGFETEIGWHGEVCFHLGAVNDYIVGGFLGYGENDHETCTEYGLSIGKHF